MSDQLLLPTNVRSVSLPNILTGVVLEMDTQSTCSRNTVSYTIAIDGVAVPPGRIITVSSTRYIVSGLEANRMYTASVRTVISNCVSDQSNITFEIMAESESLISFMKTMKILFGKLKVCNLPMFQVHI